MRDTLLSRTIDQGKRARIACGLLLLACAGFVGCQKESQSPTKSPSAANHDRTPGAHQPDKQIPKAPFSDLIITPAEKIEFEPIKLVETLSAEAFGSPLPLKGHESVVEQVTISADGSHALTADRDGFVVWWKLEEQSILSKGQLNSGGAIVGVCLDGPNERGAILQDNGKASIWDLADGAPQRVVELETGSIIDVQFLSDPRILACFKEEVKGRRVHRSIVLVEVASGETIVESSFNSMRDSTDSTAEVREPSSAIMGVSYNSSDFVFFDGITRYGKRHLNPTDERNRDGRHTFSGGEFGRLFGYDHSRPTHAIDVEYYPFEPGLYFVASDDGRIDFCRSQKEKNDGLVRLPLQSICRDIRHLEGSAFLAVYDGDTGLAHYDLSSGNFAHRWKCQRTDIESAVLGPAGKWAITSYTNGDLLLFRLPPPALSPEIRTWQLTTEFQKHWNAKDFAALNELADKARRTEKLDAYGYPYEWRFYNLLGRPDEETEDAWEAHLLHLRDWRSEFPETATPYIALAEALHNYGWRARGSGVISTVTEQGYIDFKDRLTEAADVLTQGQEYAANSASLYESQIRIAKGLGLDKSVMIDSFEAGQAINPQYYPLYTSLAICLLPRWFGEPGELAKFLDAQAEELGEEEHAVMYAAVFANLKCFLSAAHLNAFGFDFETLAHGAELLRERCPTSTSYTNLVAWSAARVQNRDAAQQAFAQLGKEHDETYWGSLNNYLAVRAWANNQHDSPHQAWVSLVNQYAAYAVAISPDGKTIATGGTDDLAQIKLWDADSGKLLASLPSAETVYDMDFHPSGEKLVVAGGDGPMGELSVWTLSGDTVAHQELEPPPGRMRTARFSPNGKWLAAGGDGGEIWIWTKKSANAEPTKLEVGGKVTALKFSQDSSQLVFVNGSMLGFVDMESGERTSGVEFSKSGLLPTAVDIFDQRIYVGTNINYVLAFDAQDVTKQPNFLGPRPWRQPPSLSPDASAETKAAVNRPYFLPSVEVSPDGKLLAFSHSYRIYHKTEVGLHNVVIVDIETGKPRAVLEGHYNYVDNLRFLPDSKRLASISRDGTLRVWNVPPAEDEEKPSPASPSSSESPSEDSSEEASDDSAGKATTVGAAEDTEKDSAESS